MTYLPALLAMLGPSIVTVYKASLSGQRIVGTSWLGFANVQLLYSPPPLLPLTAFAWCIWAMGLPPSSAANAGAHASAFLGNVGLMELDAVKSRTGGWVASKSTRRGHSADSSHD